MALIIGTKFGEHDPCYAAVFDGEVRHVYEEERFNRVKHGISCAAWGFHQLLTDMAVDIGDVDYFTNYLVPERFERCCDELHRFWGEDSGERVASTIAGYRAAAGRYRELMGAHGIPDHKIVDVRHHVAHCAGVFFPSPFEEAAILSVDGGGEAETAVLAHGVGNRIDVLDEVPHPHSLGNLYLAATRWLGWDYGEEGKTMALASYGDPVYYDHLCENYVEIGGPAHLRFVPPRMPQQALLELVGPPRQPGEPLETKHKDFAASIQKITNEVMLALAGELKRRTGSRTILVTGGVGLNSVANGELMRSGIFDVVHAYPQANDTGTAVGGALYVEHVVLGSPRKSEHVMRHAYLGRAVEVENIDSVAAKYGLAPRRSDDVARETAGLLAEGKIVGWVQGRSEIGPRALGNRSILADPRDVCMRDKINIKVKNRETWRPFAPSVLREDAQRYFEATIELPYMIVVDTVRPEWRDKIAAIMHVDHTARVQTVDRDTNPRFHALIGAFKDLTGIGMLLNTSFNARGEPLVDTAEQAVRDFLRSEMDILVVDDWIFDGKNGAAAPEAFHPLETNFDRLPDTAHVHAVLLHGAQHLPTFARFFEEAASRGVRTTLWTTSSKREVASVVKTLPRKHALRQAKIRSFEMGETRGFGGGIGVLLAPFSGSDLVFRSDETVGMAVRESRRLAREDGMAFWAVDMYGGLTDLSVRHRLAAD